MVPTIKKIIGKPIVPIILLQLLTTSLSFSTHPGALPSSNIFTYALALAKVDQQLKQNTQEENNKPYKVFCNPCGIAADVSAIYTAFAECCNATFTVLSEIEAEINGIFTTLQDTPTLFIIAITDLNGIYTSLEACCEGTFTALAAATDINSVYTVLESIYEGICSPQFIRQSDLDAGTTFTISQPGLYIFAEDLTFSPIIPQPAIAITADQVTIDMCNMSLMQGNSTPGVVGFDIPGTPTPPGRSNVTIRNGIIKNLQLAGIFAGDFNGVNTACSRIRLYNLDVIGDGTSSFVGIAFLGAVDPVTFTSQVAITLGVLDSTGPLVANSEINNCTVSKVAGVGIALFGTQDTVINNCAVTQGVPNNDSQGFFIGGNIKLAIKNTTVNDLGTTTDPLAKFTGFNFEKDLSNQQCLLENCVVVNNVALSETIGFALTGTLLDIQLQNCTAKSNQSMNAACYGFIVRGADTFPNLNTILRNCLAADNIATESNCFGFNYETVTNCHTLACNAFDNISTGTDADIGAVGFYITESLSTTATGCQGCSWSYCTAAGNTGVDAAHSWGFDSVATTTSSNIFNAYIANIAYQNGPIGLAETTQQIITDDIQTGGVPANSVLPTTTGVTSINDLNDLILANPYINVRLADSLVL